MLMLILDAFIYGLITWYIETVFPGWLVVMSVNTFVGRHCFAMIYSKQGANNESDTRHSPYENVMCHRSFLYIFNVFLMQSMKYYLLKNYSLDL